MTDDALIRISKNIDDMGLAKGFVISLLQDMADRDINDDGIVGGIATVIIGCALLVFNRVDAREHILEMIVALLVFWAMFVISCMLVRFVARRVLGWISRR